MNYIAHDRFMFLDTVGCMFCRRSDSLVINIFLIKGGQLHTNTEISLLKQCFLHHISYFHLIPCLEKTF